MKKILVLFMSLIYSVGILAGVQYSQEEILKELKPRLEKARLYSKFKEIEARPARNGEEIFTITADGLETKNTASIGDYIVRNTTDAREMYIVKASKFEKRYVYSSSLEEEWSIYKAIGKIKAIKIDEDLITKLGVEDEFYFMAPWGQKMIVKNGDYMVSPLDYSETYRIAEKEFFETYR